MRGSSAKPWTSHKSIESQTWQSRRAERDLSRSVISLLRTGNARQQMLHWLGFDLKQLTRPRHSKSGIRRAEQNFHTGLRRDTGANQTFASADMVGQATGKVSIRHLLSAGKMENSGHLIRSNFS